MEERTRNGLAFKATNKGSLRRQLSLVVFLFWVGLFSCTEKSEAIFSTLESKCQENVDHINMKSVVISEWKNGCYFDNGLSKVEVENILGMKIPGKEEFVSRLVFVDNNMIVGYDEREYQPSPPDRNVLVFEHDSSTTHGYFCFDRKHSKFVVKREKVNNSCVYHLALEND